MNKFKSVILILLIMSISGFKVFCQEKSNSILSEYLFNSDSTKIITLPKSLKEISGLALLNSEEVLTNNDEEGIIYKVNINSGKVTGYIKIGDEKVKNDFEGITIADNSIYIVSSSGLIYKLNNSFSSSTADFVKFKTELSVNNDVEGLCYDATTKSLLLACKNEPGYGLTNVRAVYAFSLSKMKFESTPRFLISLNELEMNYGIKNFAPSGIEKHPLNGNYFVISANPAAIIELNTQGKILSAIRLDNKIHPQPEGIAFLNNGTMLISDEGQKDSGKITIYKLNSKYRK